MPDEEKEEFVELLLWKAGKAREEKAELKEIKVSYTENR